MDGLPFAELQALASAARRLTVREIDTYATRRPLTAALSADSGVGFVNNVPLHWMMDWPMPFPMAIATAKGTRLVDLDGNRLTDFCLGDSGALFGHAPGPVVTALRETAEKGFCHMLPSGDAAATGALLARRFGLPRWQVATTASDANRFALRVARAITGRRKILVFDGCYHGTVEETMVDLEGDQTIARASVLGPVGDIASMTVCVPFNDLPALTRALASGEIACVITEPALTNCSMVLPQAGFHAELRRLTRAAGTLLLIDETHTISTALGGYARHYGLEPDLMVIGKPIAGGVPAAIWGMTADVAQRFADAKRQAPPGHSGIGTTLSGSTLQLACIRACLEYLMTPENYARMEASAARIETGLQAMIAAHDLPWHVARLGARLEIVFTEAPLSNAVAARAASQPEIEQYLHIALLNLGFLLTPFHNMMLIAPDLRDADADDFLASVEIVVAKLVAEARGALAQA